MFRVLYDLRRKFVCIRSHRKEVIIDLCCNMGYFFLRLVRGRLFLAEGVGARSAVAKIL